MNKLVYVIFMLFFMCSMISLSKQQNFSADAESLYTYAILTGLLSDFDATNITSYRELVAFQDLIRNAKYNFIAYPGVKNTKTSTVFIPSNVLPTRKSVSATIYRPNNYVANNPVIFFAHGGSFTWGTRTTYFASLSILANLTQCIYVYIEYALAPESRFPIGLNETKLVIEFMIRNRNTYFKSSSRAAIGVFGDSSGGNFASCIANELTNSRINFQILIYPVIDLVAQTQSKRLYVGDRYLFYSDSFKNLEDNYFGNNTADRNSSRYITHKGVTNKTPTTLMILSELDPFRDDGLVLFKPKLDQFSVPNTVYVIPGMTHGFFGYPDKCTQTFLESTNYINTFLKPYKFG